MVTSTSINTAEAMNVQPLVESALRGLVPMFDPERKLFCYRLKRTEKGLEKEGVSYRYTLITLKGLLKADSAGFRSTIDFEAVLRELDRNLNWITNAGDLGLYLWLKALASPDAIPQLIANIELENVIDRYSDLRQRRTMELAWFLSGLAHICLVSQCAQTYLRDLAFRTYRLLEANQDSYGFFKHMPTTGSLAGRLRGRIGSFADQVYPIYALSKFAQAYDNREALDRASGCARAICDAQGPLGEWWWHYNSATGRTSRKYPVYSVHQEGMAPMALFALSEAGGSNFERNIYAGLEWITGKNVLNLDMRDSPSDLVWRSLCAPVYKAYLDEILGFLRLPSSSTLRAKYECRPYELGWLLYAFAGPPTVR